MVGIFWPDGKWHDQYIEEVGPGPGPCDRDLTVTPNYSYQTRLRLDSWTSRDHEVRNRHPDYWAGLGVIYLSWGPSLS
jgi:hypothetical protein